MTSRDELTPTASRSKTARSGSPARSSVARSGAAPRPHWTRRRGPLGFFAAFAAVGFLAAYAGPAGVALAEGQPPVATTTAYASAIVDPQNLVIAGVDGSAAGLTRSSYSVYVPPPPPPPPAPAAESSSSSSSSSSRGDAPRPTYSGGGSSAEWMAAAGISQSDWGYVDYIVSHESGWNPNATSSNGYCGLVQTACGKLGDGTYDPVANLSWGTGYANSRYGGWAGAYDFWASNGWW